MSLYMENLNDLYWDDNDLSCDLQVDSGTLACVACGILGFPLMSVIQPSEKASMELLPADDILVQGRSGVSEPENTEGLSTARDLVPPENNFPRCSMNNFVKGWNTSHKFLRPRIFCLEHAVQILELLKSKGGANFLIICHSDYQKIKAHAMAVAEESGCPFKYNEIPLDNASQDDLNLIDLAIDDEVHNECGEDWTSKLGINLRYCVKVRKNSSSMQVQHALTLGGLFCDRSPNSDILSVKWKSRRLRSKIKMSEPANSKSSESIQIKKDEMLGAKLDDIIVNKEEKIIQYSRRNSKLKQSNSAEVSRNCGYLRNHPPEEVEAATCGSLDHGTALRNNSTSVSMSQMQLEIKVLEATSEMPLTSVPAQVLNSLANATQVVECVEVPTETHTVKEKVDIERGDSNSDMLYAIKVTEERKEKNYNGASPLIITSDERLDTPTEEQVMEDCNIKNEGCNLATMDYSDRGCNVENDGDTLINEFVGRFEAKMDDTVVEGSCMNSEVGGCVNLKQGIQSMDGSSSIEESSEVLRETCAAEEFSNGMSLHNVGQPDIKTENGRDQVGSLSPSSRQESFKSPSQPHNAAELCKTVIPGTEMQQEIEMLKGNNKENSVSSDITLLNQPCPTSVEEGTEVVSSKEDLSCGVILVNEVEQKIETSRDDTSQELREPESVESNVESRLPAGKGKKRKQAVEQNTENKFDSNVFIRSPCEGLRRRVGKPAISSCESDINITLEQKPETKKARKPSDISSPSNNTKEKSKGLHRCDLESCRMSFKKKSELEMHKRNRCPHEGCHKRFTSHKYAVLHQRVHDDERPLKCPWKDCSMSFKWAWARTEHLRVHTGERPYHCKIDGCGLSFRFVSDYSRHRRKTGHYVTPPPA